MGSTAVPKVLVVMGSDSDFPIVNDTLKTLKNFGVEYEAKVCSAHRTPEQASELAKNAHAHGFDVIIAAAGKAAHLPGVIASYTTLPVIGVPIKSSTLDGLDSLLSIVQMPSGIPVATVAIDGCENAALLAVQILSVKYDHLKTALKEHKNKLAQKVEQKDKALQEKLKNGI